VHNGAVRHGTDGTDWDDDAIATAFADWVWVPDGSEVWPVPGGRLIRFPAYIARRMHAVAAPPTGTETTVLAEVLDRCREHGEAEVRWHVSDRPATALVRELLRDSGGAVEETLDQLAFTGTPPSADSGDLDVRAVLDEDSARAVDHIDQVVFDEKPASEERIRDLVTECRAQWDARSDARYVAWRSGTPLGSGGLSRAGEVLRLWGGATLPEARRQGVYGAVLRERLRQGWEWGTTLALVRGRVQTSAPILRRTGFRRVGRELSIRLEVTS
jgi:GNAT superfamily N-acetyltransferase